MKEEGRDESGGGEMGRRKDRKESTFQFSTVVDKVVVSINQ